MFLQQLINGLILGGAYALISVGLTMSFGIMKISNFAHVTIYMLGGYACYFFGQRLGLPFFCFRRPGHGGHRPCGHCL